MLAVLNEFLFRQRIVGSKLAPQVCVLGADGQCGAGCRTSGRTDCHAAAHEGTEHREKPCIGAANIAAVLASGRDICETVKQVLPRHAVMVEHESAVVHAQEATFGAVVANRNPVDRRTVIIADPGNNAVHTMGFFLSWCVELAKNRSPAPIARGVAQKPFLRGSCRRIEDEFFRLGVVMCRGFE